MCAAKRCKKDTEQRCVARRLLRRNRRPQQHALNCSSVFLEFGDPQYRHMFAHAAIERYDVLDVAPGPDVTIAADLQHYPDVPDNTYDVIVCTQVLEHVPNPFDILKPGGRLLVTVPAAYPYHAVPRAALLYPDPNNPSLLALSASKEHAM